MLKIPFVFMVLATTALSPLISLAQTADHKSGHEAPVGAKGSADRAWLSIEENVRNLSDTLKTDKLVDVSSYASSMAAAMDTLLAANIHEEVKPHEEEHLLKSLDALNVAIDELVSVSESNDKAVIEAAVAQVSGSVTLTRIDVPPGLLEKISGSGVRAEIVNTPALKKGVPETVTLRLKSAITGKPLTSEDLSVVHTQIVHALVIDPQLADYTHAHPEEIDVPGEYTFTLTPQSDCTYRLWADVTPVKGKQEYAIIDIPGKDGCGTLPVDRTDSVSATADGFTVTIKGTEQGLHVGKAAMLDFEIKNAAGETVTALEPIMGAYAHIVGFYEDYRTIAHLHPTGAEPKADSDRGTSPLTFHFEPEHPGFVKLFMQIEVDGKEHQFPFGITVQE